jgi:Domain of unknown function (DUF4915)
MDVTTQHKEWIDVGLGQLLASGVGICADEKYLYHVLVAQSDFSTHLSILERNSLEVVNLQPLPEVNDGHSLLRFGDDLVVVSTGTDEIFAYPLRDGGIGDARLFWSPTNSGADTHHVNSLAVAGGELLCSAFGPKGGDSWYTAMNGYIRNLTSDRIVLDGLRQPHSVTWHDDRLFFCNSLEGSVNTADGVIAYLYGYSRGLAFGPHGTMYAGTSLSRRPSGSDDSSVFGNPSDSGDLHGQCALIQMTDTGTNRVESSIAPFGNEIYDIFVL